MTVNILWLFLAVLWVVLRCVIVVFAGHTHLLLLIKYYCLEETFYVSLNKIGVSALEDTKCQLSKLQNSNIACLSCNLYNGTFISLSNEELQSFWQSCMVMTFGHPFL